MSLVTLLPRVLPICLLSQTEYPKLFRIWLKYIPISVMAAIVSPEILIKNSHVNLGFDNDFFWVSLPTFIVAFLTKSLMWTIFTGVGSLALLRLFFV